MEKLLTTAVTLMALTLPAAADELLGPQDIDRAILTYQQNKLRFARDYGGRTIKFIWTFQDAEHKTYEDGVRITLGPADYFKPGVWCVTTDQETVDRAIEWKPGQRVKATGVIKEVSWGKLVLRDCTAEAVPPQT
jgi:hypothetical protein